MLVTIVLHQRVVTLPLIVVVIYSSARPYVVGYELPRFTERQLGHIGMRASLLAALFLICACLTPSLAQTKELWPLAIGNEWNFNARALGANVGETMRLSITSTEKIGDTDTYVLTWSYPSQGRVFQKEY